MKVTKSFLKHLTYQVNGAAIEVHKQLGPGLLESVYHKCLKHEFKLRGIKFRSELAVPIDYKGINAIADLRCDFLVEDILLVELKAAEAFHPIFDAQLLTYMKLMEVPKGVLYNFNVVNLFQEGQKTLVNEYFRSLPE